MTEEELAQKIRVNEAVALLHNCNSNRTTDAEVDETTGEIVYTLRTDSSENSENS